MPSPLDFFHANMRDADAHTGIHNFLQQSVGGPVNYDDLLRSKLVYAVSAFDKLIHDLIRIGMVDTFLGGRPPTAKYLAETVSLSTLQQLATAGPLPPAVVFDNTIRAKHKALSFQDPTKVAEGLSFIWDEKHKWQQISAAIGEPEEPTRTRLKLIADRRNAIVHEADLHPVTNEKQSISLGEADDLFSFLHRVGNAIDGLVK